MITYRVVWEIDVDAASPLEAALEAERILRDYDGQRRPVLDVSVEGVAQRFDLEEQG